MLDDQQLEKFVCYAVAWSIGGLYEAQDREAFHNLMFSKNAPIPPKKDDKTVFEHFVSPDYGDWKICNPEDWKPTPGAFQFSQVLMPTVDSFRSKKLIDFVLCQEKSSMCNNAALLLGVSGSAKTSSVLMYKDYFDRDKMLFKRINFSSATTPRQFQETIETECDSKFTQRDFGPPGGKSLSVFIDDMSMPLVNKWGDQVTLEIVRQLIEQGGFYMLDKKDRGNFKNIKNLYYVGAMNHPGGGRNDIPNRLKRQFLIFNMILPTDIKAIYQPIIKYVFRPTKTGKLEPEAEAIVEKICDATIGMWNQVKNTMLPTPQKFHYVFNMRELSRIFKGILQVEKKVINESLSVKTMKSDLFLVGLWRHECERVFADKMITQKDKDIIQRYIDEKSFEHFPHLESQVLEAFNADKTFIFVDFMRADVRDDEGLIVELAPKVYEAVGSMEVLRARCINLLDDYNTKYTSKKMNLVLFDDALKHLTRISRSIQMQRSSVLLVGVGGSGKQSLTRLAAEIGRHWCHQMVITKTFGEKDLKEEIKRLFDVSGHLGRPTTFVMTDAEVKKEEFLEYINMILSTGEIPGLLAKDEREVILGDIRNDYVKQRQMGNVDPSNAELFNFFVDRVRDNLHIVLCFSPVG